jgi:IclR family KDG regulon transcriptional repressor
MAEQSVQSLDRTLDIIELLATKPDGLGVTDIGQALSLHKSTVHRLISALARRGYIEKDIRTGMYRIGLKFVEISSLLLNHIELKTEALPYMRRLAGQLGQTVHLAIRDGTEIVYIEKVDSLQSLRMYSHIGKRIPAYCSALGKVLLSGIDRDVLLKTVSGIEMTARTPNTITNRDELIRQVDMVRSVGWASDNEENEEGIRCIAAPIYDFTGKIIAAMSVSGAKDIISPDRDEMIGGMAVDTAREISARMGYVDRR